MPVPKYSIRPYIAVIVDSFHEALASRVLWILLAASTLVLVLLAPLSFKEQRALELRRGSVRDWPTFVARIKEQSVSDEPSPGKRIWELGNDEFKKTILDATAEEGAPKVTREVVSVVLKNLNQILSKPDLYDAAAWNGIALDPEATELLKKGVSNLPKEDLTFLNRSLLIAAYRGEMGGIPNKELHFSYLKWTIGEPLPVTKEMATPLIKGILGQVMSFFVGTIGVFVAILVTSAMIPRTFEAGSVDLLMSKPVSRWLLFLAKFVGGCAFILLNAAYFIFGLWLVVGMRFEIWSSQLLLCIPLFMFLFAIYYCVSTLAGVWWKNPIVSVVVTIVFWVICFSVGAAKNVVEQLFLNPNRLVNIVPAVEPLVGVNQSGEFVEWQATERQWEKILEREGPNRRAGPGTMIVGPVYNATGKELTYIEQPPSMRGFGFFQPQPSLVRATWSGSWQRNVGPPPPSGASWIFLNPQGETVVVGVEGIFRLSEAASKAADSVAAGIGQLFGSGGEHWENISAKTGLSFVMPFAAAMAPESGDIAVFSSEQLTHLRRESDGTYSSGATRKFSDRQGPAALAFAGSAILLAFADGDVFLLDVKDLATRREFQPVSKSEPHLTLAASTGRHFVVLFHNGTLWLLDAEKNSPRTIGNNVSAAAFEGGKNLLVADRATRVTRYELDGFKPVQRLEPEADALDIAYRYAILPFYKIFPKPGELSNVVNYLLTDQDTVAMGGPPGQTDLRQARIKIDVYGPLWSSFAFVLVTLAFTCWLVSRADL